MKETDEIMGMIKEEGAAYFARERGNKVEVGLYLERLIEERGMKKKDIVRKLNLEESYARKLFGGQRIPTRKILLQCAFLLSLDLSDTQRLLDIGQKPRLYPRIRYDAAIIYDTAKGIDLVICFMSQDLTDTGAAQNTIAADARAIYGYYNE